MTSLKPFDRGKLNESVPAHIYDKYKDWLFEIDEVIQPEEGMPEQLYIKSVIKPRHCFFIYPENFTPVSNTNNEVTNE